MCSGILGYDTHVIHNNEADFYSRRTVFPMLGFDSFTSAEYMPDVTDTTETAGSRITFSQMKS